MSAIEELKKGHKAFEEAQGKLEDARFLTRAFVSEADPQTEDAKNAVHDAKVIAQRLGKIIEELEDIAGEFSPILGMVEDADK